MDEIEISQHVTHRDIISSSYLDWLRELRIDAARSPRAAAII